MNLVLHATHGKQERRSATVAAVKAAIVHKVHKGIRQATVFADIDAIVYAHTAEIIKLVLILASTPPVAFVADIAEIAILRIAVADIGAVYAIPRTAVATRQGRKPVPVNTFAFAVPATRSLK